MTKTIQDFEMWGGDHRNLRFSVTGSDGSGKDLTGACVVWILEDGVGSGSLIRKATGDGITISGSQFTVSLTPADTINLVGLYYHESEITDAASQVSTAAVGTGTINRSGV